MVLHGGSVVARKNHPRKTFEERSKSAIALMLVEMKKRSPLVKSGEPCNFDYIVENGDLDFILQHLVCKYGGVVHDCRDVMGMRIVCLDDFLCVAAAVWIRLARWKLVLRSDGVFRAVKVCGRCLSVNFHALGADSGRSLRACVV
eukprot:1631413-Rhodomonas_salina.3